ncbi:MAG: molybdopterin-dependent oxidoreductase, partial [Bacteroidota bacterium]
IPHEEIIPGRSVWYATVCRECPAGCGMTVRVREGRATKAEGNPLHPVNQGALCARGQASLQGLYNPDRIQMPLLRNAAGGFDQLTWAQAESVIVTRMREIAAKGRGEDIVWVTPALTGSLDALVDEWLAITGSRRRYRYEPLAHERLKAASKRMFDLEEIPTFDFTGIDTLYSFGSDFLETWLSPVEFGREFAGGRGVADPKRRCRFTYFGPRLSMTAASADHRLDVHPDMLGNLALSMVRVILDEGLAAVPATDVDRLRALLRGFAPDQVSWPVGLPVERIVTLAREFGASKSSLAVAGGPVVEGEFGTQTLGAVLLLNYVCGNMGRSVRFGPLQSASRVNSYADMDRLARDMEKDGVPALFLSEVNPVFTMPHSSGFAEAMAKVPFVVACASVMDETAARATLILPLHHSLESWGDYEPRGGVHGLMQPVMQPVFATKMLGDILLETGESLGNARMAFYSDFAAYVKERWKAIHARLGKALPFETFWIETLARGGIWEHRGSKPVTLRRELTAADVAGPSETPARGGETFTLITYPSVAHYDGRGANKPWLQELPDPMTRLVWGSWVEISPEDASRLGIANGDRVQVTSPYARFELPAHVYRGMRKGFVAIPFGQGHHDYGRYATGVGVNAADLLDPKPSPDRSGGLLWFGTTVELLRLPGKIHVASVQEAESQHDREIIQEVPLTTLIANPVIEPHEEPSLYPGQTYPVHRWGMTIDLDKCTGCSACVTACYAENNVPVVGMEEVAHGREMAWIRIDRYYADQQGEAHEPAKERAGFIPVICQQCGSAPCETVCPVYAAYHTEEGLNGQVYNRCIGTRYCANNCPYKVRRFNWFNQEIPEPLNWQLNPDVTVRSPGVMEKCTFCVQRIVEAKNNARIDRRALADGEILTACQQACPARAITFGDLKDPASAVSRASEPDEPRPYHLLEKLNTRPAVAYLKKITT